MALKDLALLPSYFGQVKQTFYLSSGVSMFGLLAHRVHEPEFLEVIPQQFLGAD